MNRILLILIAIPFFLLFCNKLREVSEEKKSGIFPLKKTELLIPTPDDNKLNTERIELGRMLFFDPRLSGSNWISCATCHNPGLGFSDGLPTAIGHGMKVLGKNTPTIVNSAFGNKLFWDGRANSLEEQALGPIQAAGEMNQKMDELLVELKAIKGYVALFEKAYPKEDITPATIGKAIASFERTINSFDSPYDSYLKGDKTAMSESAIRGLTVFSSKGKCVACHMGNNFTDDGFHNLGLKSNKSDPGRFAFVPIKSMKGAFKTPTLRDVALTAPYMHDGSYKTLEEVMEHYDRGGDEKSNIDPNITRLGLTPEEKKDLVAFMTALTGKPKNIITPELPQN